MDPIMREPLLHYVRNGSRIDYARLNEETRRTIREVGVRNMYIRTRLHGLLAALRSEGADAVALKGAHLMHEVYPFGVRPLEDIDLLIERDHLGLADRILTSVGYRQQVKAIDLQTHLTFSNKVTYINRDHPVIPVDLHFALGPYPYLGRMNEAVVRAHTATVRTDEGELRVLDPEALVVHLCLHLFQHHFDDWLVSCCDIVAALRFYGERFDRKRFVRLVNGQRLALPVGYALEKAAALADAEALRGLAGELHRPSPFERWVFASSLKQSRGPDRYFIQYVTTPGLRPKLQGAAKIVAPGSRYLAIHHDGSYFGYLRHITKTAAKLLAAVLPGKRR